MEMKIKHNPLIHIKRRVNVPGWQAWLIRGSAVVVALLVCAIITACIQKGSFGYFFKYLFSGTFGTSRRILVLFQDMAMLLIVGLAVTPAFKMKYWNIGAEGQVLISALVAAVTMYFLGASITNNALLVIVMLLFSILAGIIWAVIPAVFKAQWNANETLFTLMMNYIAARVVSFSINKIVTDGSGVIGVINQGSKLGWIPKVGGYDYIINIILVLVLSILLTLYLRFSKHGYELSVVGESINTARYVGINVKKVIIRTMCLSGALCGVAGFLLVSGSSHTINNELAGGNGFTAILVSWLAQFNPLIMIVTSFLVTFIDQGSAEVATMLRLGGAFNELITGVFFFFVIACEFFINYSIVLNNSKKNKNNKKEVKKEENNSISDNPGDEKKETKEVEA